MVEMYLLFKSDVFRSVLHAQNLTKQCNPEGLALAFLIASALPALGKVFRGCAFLYIVHSCTTDTIIPNTIL